MIITNDCAFLNEIISVEEKALNRFYNKKMMILHGTKEGHNFRVQDGENKVEGTHIFEIQRSKEWFKICRSK